MRVGRLLRRRRSTRRLRSLAIGLDRAVVRLDPDVLRMGISHLQLRASAASVMPAPMTDLPPTERRNQRARELDLLSTKDVVALMNDEDAGVPSAVRACLDDIARA